MERPETQKATRSEIQEKIVRAAKRRFDHFGFKKTTMEELAADVEISKGAVYLHFKSKEDILFEVVSDMIGENLQKLEEIRAGDSAAPDKIQEMVLFWVDRVYRKKSQVFGVEPPEVFFDGEIRDRFLTLIFPRIVQAFAAVVQDGINEGSIRRDADPAEVAMVVTVNIKHFVHMSMAPQDTDWRNEWLLIWKYLKSGICAEPNTG